MTIDVAYRIVNFCLNAEQQGKMTPSQFNTFSPEVQLHAINQRLTPKYDDKGNKVSGFGVDDNWREDLRNLLMPPQTIAVAAGVATTPTDYIYTGSMTTAAGLPITEATPDEIAVLNQSQIKPPTAGRPKYVIHQNGFNIYPTSITSIKLAYLRKPITPIWNYTEANDRAVYAATGGIIGDGDSHDWEVDELIHFELVQKILQYAGLNLQLNKVLEYSVAMNQGT